VTSLFGARFFASASGLLRQEPGSFSSVPASPADAVFVAPASATSVVVDVVDEEVGAPEAVVAAVALDVTVAATGPTRPPRPTSSS
jgi:hypothetical protein